MSKAHLIERAGAGDLPGLFGLAMTVFGDVPGWSDERVLSVLTSAVVFVAREGRQPVGYIALRRDAANRLMVEQVLVAPCHERRGIGRELLSYAEGFAISEGAPTLRLIVEESNVAARSFYRRRGFVPVGREEFELVLPQYV